jgi:hypothetical protein
MNATPSPLPASRTSDPSPSYAVDPLWIAIRDFPLDDAAADFSFSQRLARDHLWTDAHAERVIAEYRRFLYLMARADKTVTPSGEVDEAWHLHLSYTRSYWDGLCRIVGRPLHHEPTEGGPEESARFREAYSRTLALYLSTFGTMPPPDIWPAPDKRFDPQLAYRTVPAGKFWLVRKHWSRSTGDVMVTMSSIATGIVAFFLAAALTGMTVVPVVLGLAWAIGSAHALDSIFGVGRYSLVVFLATGSEGANGSNSDGGSSCGGGCGGCGG